MFGLQVCHCNPVNDLLSLASSQHTASEHSGLITCYISSLPNNILTDTVHGHLLFFYSSCHFLIFYIYNNTD